MRSGHADVVALAQPFQLARLDQVIQLLVELQAQLEGTENRISVERKKFNEVAQDYNTYIRKFPNNLIAGMFDFEKKEYFEADAGAGKAPKVEF